MPNYSTLWPVIHALCTFVQYLIEFCSRQESASNVVSDVDVVCVNVDVLVKFGDSRSNCSPDIRVAHFVMDNDERTTADGLCGNRHNALRRFA